MEVATFRTISITPMSVAYMPLPVADVYSDGILKSGINFTKFLEQ